MDIDALPHRHRVALNWFASSAGRVVGWPGALPDGTLLATRAKGIYKPSWSTYALSVREMLSRPYPDERPVPKAEGGWSYRYFQENHDPNARDREYTNVALLRNIRDGVPVGVMRQVASTPTSQYEILGVALVRAWKDGYFTLEGNR